MGSTSDTGIDGDLSSGWGSKVVKDVDRKAVRSKSLENPSKRRNALGQKKFQKQIDGTPQIL